MEAPLFYWYKLIRWAEDDMKFFMKKTTFLIIAFITLISVGCGHASDMSTNSDNSEIEGAILNNIPSGKYELFSILNAVYEANPNCLENQVKVKEFKDMLLATLNSRAKRNPNLFTEFPTTFYTFLGYEQKDGNFVVCFNYQLYLTTYPEMNNYGFIDYNIYTIMSRESYSKMKNGKYLIRGKYKGPLDEKKFKDIHILKIPMVVGMYVRNKLEIKANLGNFYYEDVSVELIEDL